MEHRPCPHEAKNNDYSDLLFIPCQHWTKISRHVTSLHSLNIHPRTVLVRTCFRDEDIRADRGWITFPKHTASRRPNAGPSTSQTWALNPSWSCSWRDGYAADPGTPRAWTAQVLTRGFCFNKYTVGPLYFWVSHPQIQTTVDQKSIFHPCLGIRRCGGPTLCTVLRHFVSGTWA